MNSKHAFFACLSLLAGLIWLFVSGEGISALSSVKPSDLGKNYALLIGINGYNEWPKMESPVNDAESMAKVLVEKYNFSKSRITLLTDKSKDKPTLVNILTSLDDLTGKLKEKDNLLVFFAGQSTEDDDGETYWIPIDGKKTTKLTWMKHSDLVEAYFGNDNFKAKNLLILTDSMFQHALIRPRAISLSPFDLRYPEKIAERALKRSREVIAFGDQHWPATQQTGGLGLFSYYIHKALSENELEVIDFENLIFDEEVIFAISKIAGTRLQRGRLRTKMDARGQYVIAKTIPLPVVHVAEAGVSPEKAYPGDDFTFKAKTDKPAAQVFVEAAGKKYPMKGKGTSWELAAKFDTTGKIPFRVFATNENDVSGKDRKGQVTVIKKRAEAVEIASAAVSPAQGKQGDRFRFTVTTKTPAQSVQVAINDKTYKMTGSGTSWSLNSVIDEVGDLSYKIAAINEDGVEGAPEDGLLKISAVPINVVAIKSEPETGYAGEEFLITVNTSSMAKSVSLNMDGKELPMEGSGKTWKVKTRIEEIGAKPFTVAALNVENVPGPPKTGQIVTKKSPLPIPNVAAADVSIVSPGKGFAGDSYTFSVKTTAPSEKVFVEIDGKRIPMQGSGTDWKLTTKIDKAGANPYRVLALNKDGAQGQPGEGSITTKKRPSIPVNIVSATVNPVSGLSAKPFTFNVKTDKPAKRVILAIGKTRFPMKGSNTEWTLQQKVEQAGKQQFSVIALNQDMRPGVPKSGVFQAFAQRFRLNSDGTVTDLMNGKKSKRFIDNGNGTITDLVTSLMWLKTPKQVAENYDNAVEYCRSLDEAGLKGWRLPTIVELNRLVDKKRQNPALPAGHPFTNVITHVGYWSKTRHKFGPQYMYQMSLWYGKANHLKKTENAIVWPVRYVELPEG